MAAGGWALEPTPSVFRFSPARTLVGAALVLAATALVVWQQDVRTFEAALARGPLGALLGEVVHVPGTDLVFYPDHDGSGLRALKITFSCSSVPIVAPLALLGGAMALTRRLDVGRVLVGTALAIVVVFAVNLLRIVIIAVATSTYGFDGYEVSHRIIGSAVTVVGACVAFIVTFRVVAQAAGAHRADR